MIIATKAFDVEAAARSCAPLLGDETVVQTIQNGLGSPEIAAPILGPDRVAVGVVGGFGASLRGPGHAHHNGMEMIRFGPYAGLPAGPLRDAAAIWESAGFKVALFDDIQQMVWEKLIMNVAFSGSSCATGLTIGAILADPGRLERRARVRRGGRRGRERRGRDGWTWAIRSSTSAGSAARSAAPSRRCCSTSRRAGAARSTPSTDRSPASAGPLGVPTPVNDTVVGLVRSRERALLAQPPLPADSRSPPHKVAG